MMKGYVVRRRNRYYAVIYEGLDPVMGRDRRSWNPPGTDRANAERLAARLAGAWRRAAPAAAIPAARSPLRPDAPPRRRRTRLHAQDGARGPPDHPPVVGRRRRTGSAHRNVALVAHAPKLRAVPTAEHGAWDAERLHAFLRAAAGHRHFAILWLAAFTGMRRSELVGLQWRDLDFERSAVSVTRELVSGGYERKISPSTRPPSAS